MTQPKIKGFQVEGLVMDSGTSFPGSPVVGQEFFLTEDITFGSPAIPTHLKGAYTYDGSTWLSLVTSSDTHYGWNDFLVPGFSIEVGAPATSPTWSTFRDGLNSYAFEPAAMNQVWGDIHILHDYAVGTDLYPHIHWSHTEAAGTGVVRWGLEFSVAHGHDPYPATTTIYLETPVAHGSPLVGQQYQHIISEVDNPIDGTLVDIDSVMLFRFFRDGTHANDTFTGDAFLLHLDIHYQSDGRLTPERNHPFTKFT